EQEAQSTDWAFFRFRHRPNFPRNASFSSSDSVKHAEPDSGHVGMGPLDPVLLAGRDIDVIPRTLLDQLLPLSLLPAMK
ncbi:hypothetical protein N7328_02850, partial [Aeromonas dhakensis]